MIDFAELHQKAEAHDWAAAKDALSFGVTGLSAAFREWASSEALRLGDADVVADLARYYEDEGDEGRYAELAVKAAEMGSAKACFWLGNECLFGNGVKRDYEKALKYFLKAEELGFDYEIEAIDVDVAEDGSIEDVSSQSPNCELSWWLFLLERHPTPELKCALAEWYWEPNANCRWVTVGQKDQLKALRLFEEAAQEGCKHAMFRLVMCYANGECADYEKAVSWYRFAEERGVSSIELFANRLGIESKRIRDLKPRVEAGDLMAAAELALAYLHGEGCPKDMEKACDCAYMTIGDDKSFDRFLSEIDGQCNSDDAEIMKRINAEANRTGFVRAETA